MIKYVNCKSTDTYWTVGLVLDKIPVMILICE